MGVLAVFFVCFSNTWLYLASQQNLPLRCPLSLKLPAPAAEGLCFVFSTLAPTGRVRSLKVSGLHSRHAGVPGNKQRFFFHLSFSECYMDGRCIQNEERRFEELKRQKQPWCSVALFEVLRCVHLSPFGLNECRTAKRQQTGAFVNTYPDAANYLDALLQRNLLQNVSLSHLRCVGGCSETQEQLRKEKADRNSNFCRVKMEANAEEGKDSSV